MKIAEVRSRFANIGIDGFTRTVQEYGFKNESDSGEDGGKNYFLFLDFKKIGRCRKKKTLPAVILKPCIYKKR